MSENLHKHEGEGCKGACCLRVTDLGVSAEGRTILQGIDLHIHCGQIVALIGPNGAGKSTLFKAILGQQPHTGSIQFERSGGRRTRPLVGYVPQSPAFDPGEPVSVLDLFAASISKWPVFLPIPRALRTRVEQCLSRVHGEGLIDQRLGSLSGGELQRVLLALAITPAPDLLVLDEPVSGIDQNGMKMFLDTVLRLRRTHHMAILLVSHDLKLVREYADHVVLLDKTVLCQGQPNAVFDSPAFERVFGTGEEVDA